MQYSYTTPDGYEIYLDSYNQAYWYNNMSGEWVPYSQNKQENVEDVYLSRDATLMEQVGFNDEQYAKLGDSTKELYQTLMDNGITDPDTIQSVIRGLPQLANPMLGPIPGGVIISYIPVIPLLIAYIVCLILVIIILFNLGAWLYIGKLLLAGIITMTVAYGIRFILTMIPPIGDRYNARRIPAKIAGSTKGVLDNIPIIGTISKIVLAPYNTMLWVASL